MLLGCSKTQSIQSLGQLWWFKGVLTPDISVLAGLVTREWNCLRRIRRIRRCDLVGGHKLLRVGIEDLKAKSKPPTPFHVAFRSGCKALGYRSSTMTICFLQ